MRQLQITICLAMGCCIVGSDSLPAYGCTSIMVGKQASTDGSTMTSHTCDSHRTSSQVQVVPRAAYQSAAWRVLSKRRDDDTGPMQRYGREPTGKIPQVAQTYGYIAPAYAAMNEHQLAIGESTFGGRESLKSDKGWIDCETLTRLILERAATARQAIQVAGQLLKKHGWCDEGEALTIADPNEVWVLEILGPGAGKVGAVWAAQRIPDDHISVNANASRIGALDLGNSAYYLASDNVFEVAERNGFWKRDSGDPFRFYAAYNPDGRTGFASTRREWRVFDLLAPSLHLHPNSNVLPFSVKPDHPVGPEDIMRVFRDTFEDTEFDVTKYLTVTDKDGKTVKSPLANPFMPYDMNELFKINGGWGKLGERQLARWYCMYATVTQSRAWLPDPIGGIVWLGYDNPAMTVYVPMYAGIRSLPDSYTTDGRTTGFSRRSAWWAFNRVATLAAHRWGDMRKDVAAVRDPLQEKLLAGQKNIANKATRLLREDPGRARDFLTEQTANACVEATQAYWNLGDLLWTKYDEKW